MDLDSEFPIIIPIIFGVIFGLIFIFVLIGASCVFLYVLSPKFRAWIDKKRVKRHKTYMNTLGEDGYKDLQDMTDDYVGIGKKAIKTGAQAFSEGWHAGINDDDTVDDDSDIDDVDNLTTTTKCPVCGHENKEDAKFCSNCGKRLDADTSHW